MKMLSTQVNGLLQRITEKNNESIEETARLLAQALIGEGQIYLIGFGEMEVVYINAMNAIEPLKSVQRLDNFSDLDKSDRVWLFTRYATDEKALHLARELSDLMIPFGAVAANPVDDENELADLATTYISTGLMRGLLPGENGERIVQPHALAALFIYEAVKLALDEMLMDE